MLSPAADHLRRLQDLLASARADYDTLAYIVLEGAVQVSFHSHKRSITLPIGGDDVGDINGLLEDAARARIVALEKEVVEAHALVVSETAERQHEQETVATARQQQAQLTHGRLGSAVAGAGGAAEGAADSP